MSAKQLCDALAAAGFDGGDPLDPESLDWAFLQGDDSRRMFAWIASRLRPANVLSASDLELYEQLELEGKHLEGEDLDSAFDTISAFSEIEENQEDTFLSEESLEDIRDSKLALRVEVSDLEKQLASLEWKLDLLTAQATTIAQGKKSRASAKTSANGQLTRLDEKFAKRSLETNAVLGKLAASTQELSYYHSEADIGIYLSYCDFQPYVISNLACSKELNKWFTKKFEKGALRLVGNEDMSRGDREKPHHFVVELTRINSIFAKSKRQYIEAQVEYAKEEAILSELRAQLASQQSYIHEDIHSLRRRNSELTEELKDLSLQVQECLSETVTSLCADLARLEGANMLQGDHNLKVHRQECYIREQKTFINHLVNQIAAHQFLKIAYQLERQSKFLSVYSLLKAIEMELQSYLSAINGRLDRYHLIGQAASDMIEEGSVDDRDTFLHAVRDILSSHSGAQAMTPTYVSAYALVEQISELEDELHYHQHELENVLPRERGRFIDEQSRMIQTLEQIIYVPLTHMLPKLTPWVCIFSFVYPFLYALCTPFFCQLLPHVLPQPLAQALEELEMVNQQVSASVNEVTMARDEKAKMLQQPSRNMQQERQVFTDFFCHPGRLENQVRELSSRVRAIPE
ncbi:AUGMIN subunit 3 isoform X1 [Brachypodium distachyon]|uniref:AUGMIN subunit 3 isoform X1 n=1 Tax=Brachypodium distachyon TaxID=15368 RepID=UPI000D0D8581|nr:AUGMIN subunit 3 isoform X1 [Brachypodium distachyon]XP_024317114.1 AUGMIN subunit 3 isoform X1 [Brachypodium distachyon]|eukprot:XP_024317112.1 AUGMIN subunit 3 isoform X1 [Brachypodium distachyon]